MNGYVILSHEENGTVCVGMGFDLDLLKATANKTLADIRDECGLDDMHTVEVPRMVDANDGIVYAIGNAYIGTEEDDCDIITINQVDFIGDVQQAA